MFLKNRTGCYKHYIDHHTYFASQQYKLVCKVADDTVVLTLLLYISPRCGCEIYFHKGKNSSNKGISYHSISYLSQSIMITVFRSISLWHITSISRINWLRIYVSI